MLGIIVLPFVTNSVVSSKVCVVLRAITKTVVPAIYRPKITSSALPNKRFESGGAFLFQIGWEGHGCSLFRYFGIRRQDRPRRIA